MRVARTRADLDQAVQGLRQPQMLPPAAPRSLALVPTMGALHAGHLALIAAARQMADTVCASIFVNPTQFNDASDLARYPRDEEGDLAKLAAAGCDLVWMPIAAEMYPPGHATQIIPQGPALPFEGAMRPGHFAGVATVVTMLLGQVRPDVALFGEKDWQQLQVIRRVSADLALAPRIAGVPIVREADGLAMSSRNRFLTPAERACAPALYAALNQAAAALRAGAQAGAILAAAREQLGDAGFGVEYFALIDGPSMQETNTAVPGCRLIAAARLGSVRLIDNLAVF